MNKTMLEIFKEATETKVGADLGEKLLKKMIEDDEIDFNKRLAVGLLAGIMKAIGSEYSVETLNKMVLEATQLSLDLRKLETMMKECEDGRN